MIHLFKKIFSNLFHLGFIQVTNVGLQLLLIPLVVARVGIEANGLVLMSLSLAGLFGTLINFSGNQTIPLNKDSVFVFSDTFYFRSLVFLLIALAFLFLLFSGWTFSLFLMGVLPLLLAEVFNPYAFYLVENKLQLYNLSNLISRLLAFAGVAVCIHGSAEAPSVNLISGLSLLVGYFFLWVHLLRSRRFGLFAFKLSRVRAMVSAQWPLLGSNLIVHLQQSQFLYLLGVAGQPVLLGAYAVMDKLIWGVRTILIAFSNAIYPLSISTHQLGTQPWKVFRRQVNRLLLLVMLPAGYMLWWSADWVAVVLGQDGSGDLLATYIKWAAPIPVLMALNVLNVLELLIVKNFRAQLFLSLVLLGVSALMAVLILSPYLLGALLPRDPQFSMVPFYLLLTESLTLLLYEAYRHRSARLERA